MYSDKEIIDICKSKMMAEADGIVRVSEQIDKAFVSACKLINSCKGKVIVSGLGKTGHIGSKIAASMACLGVPAFFVHSCEALHGDLGMIEKDDVVIFISNSGKSPEIISMLAAVGDVGPKTISITRDASSPLAKNTDVVILCDAGPEADELGLAPTTSSTAALALGDALAMVVSQLRGFDRKDFAIRHPGGALGAKLLQK